MLRLKQLWKTENKKAYSKVRSELYKHTVLNLPEIITDLHAKPLSHSDTFISVFQNAQNETVTSKSKHGFAGDAACAIRML